jgi:hypothetical protein
MTGSKNNRRKTVAKRGTTALPPGVKVVPAPKSAARRKLISGPDIETGGGSHTVHYHPLNSASKPA